MRGLPVIAGKYTLGRLLGRGGMGEVYEGLEAETGVRVAVKLLRIIDPENREELAARFEIEARAVRTVISEHVPRLLDAGRDGPTGIHYIAMELLRGEGLESVNARLGGMLPDLVLRISAQCCVGLEAAHKAGVIHRDLKPRNIFVATASNGERVVKLLDFGVAKLKMGYFRAPEDLTRLGSLLGTPRYMAPEQARADKNIDSRADLYSLGVVMHELLTGGCPHDEKSRLGSLLTAIHTTPARPIRETAAWVPKEIAVIVDRALELEPMARYPSAAAMLRDIDALLPQGHGITESLLVPLDVVPTRQAERPFKSQQDSELPSIFEITASGDVRMADPKTVPRVELPRMDEEGSAGARVPRVAVGDDVATQVLDRVGGIPMPSSAGRVRRARVNDTEETTAVHEKPVRASTGLPPVTPPQLLLAKDELGEDPPTHRDQVPASAPTPEEDALPAFGRPGPKAPESSVVVAEPTPNEAVPQPGAKPDLNETTADSPAARRPSRLEATGLPEPTVKLQTGRSPASFAWIFVLLAGFAGAFLTYKTLMKRAQSTTVDSAPSASTAPSQVAPSVASPSPSLTSVRVSISSENVVVEVDGKQVPVEDGGVVVSGTLGSSHQIVVRQGERVFDAEVAITDRGAVPSAVSFPEPLASVSAVPSASPVPTTVRQVPVGIVPPPSTGVRKPPVAVDPGKLKPAEKFE